MCCFHLYPSVMHLPVMFMFSCAKIKICPKHLVCVYFFITTIEHDSCHQPFQPTFLLCHSNIHPTFLLHLSPTFLPSLSQLSTRFCPQPFHQIVLFPLASNIPYPLSRPCHRLTCCQPLQPNLSPVLSINLSPAFVHQPFHQPVLVPTIPPTCHCPNHSIPFFSSPCTQPTRQTHFSCHCPSNSTDSPCPCCRSFHPNLSTASAPNHSIKIFPVLSQPFSCPWACTSNHSTHRSPATNPNHSTNLLPVSAPNNWTRADSRFAPSQ